MEDHRKELFSENRILSLKSIFQPQLGNLRSVPKLVYDTVLQSQIPQFLIYLQIRISTESAGCREGISNLHFIYDPNWVVTRLVELW